MSDGTLIQWSDASWNPIAGCTPVSPGCLNCYAATMAHRLDAMGQEKYRSLTVLRNGVRTFNSKINLVPDALTIPLTWKKPRRVFVNSMSDIFHESVPFDFIDKVFAVMALTPQHTYQVLTKRPGRMAEYTASERWAQIRYHARLLRLEAFPIGHILLGPLDNVWLGTSVEDQPRADERIPHLLKCPAALRFISAEPLLGPIDVRSGLIEQSVEVGGDIHYRSQIHWVIDGGESGPGARRYDFAWSESLQRQCSAAGVAYFRKQIGSNAGWQDADGYWHRWSTKDPKGGNPSEWPSRLSRIREFPTQKQVQPA